MTPHEKRILMGIIAPKNTPLKIIITKTPTGIYAIDENYDGPEDKDGMGHGDTTAEAIVDLLEKRGLIEVETGAW